MREFIINGPQVYYKLFLGVSSGLNRIIITKMGKNLRSFLPIRYPGYAILHIHLLNLCYNLYISYHYYSVLYSSKYTK